MIELPPFVSDVLAFPFVTETLVFVLMFVGGVGGSLAHEATHYLVACAAGRSPSVDWRDLTVEFDVEEIRRGDRVAALAPQSVGVASLTIYLLVGVPSIPGWPAIAMGWITYTLLGARSDFEVGIGWLRSDITAE